MPHRLAPLDATMASGDDEYAQGSVSRLLRASLAELQRIARPPQAPEPLPVM